MMLDRKYSAREVAEIAALGTSAMEWAGLPLTVVITAHLAAADALLTNVATIGPLPTDFARAAQALHAAATLFLLVCETGPVSAGTKQ